eukprot:jgi/Antlo1/2416/553
MSHRKIASRKRKPTCGAITARQEDTVLAMYSQGLQVTQCLCTLVTASEKTGVSKSSKRGCAGPNGSKSSTSK